MKFLAAIITENEHTYNTLENKSARLVRAIKNEGYRPTADGAIVYVYTYALIIDDEGNESLVLAIDHMSKVPLFYTNAEIDAFFSSFNDPIEPSESYTAEFKKILEAVLLQDTMLKGYFNGDNCQPYTHGDS